MENNNETPQPISIELTENVAEGTYSNLAVITHSTSEFVLDFIRVMPNVPKAKVQSRIIMTPQHAKRLMKALQEIQLPNQFCVILGSIVQHSNS